MKQNKYMCLNEMFMRFMCKIGEPFTPLGLLMRFNL